MTPYLHPDSQYQYLFDPEVWGIEHRSKRFQAQFISYLEKVAHGDFGDVWEEAVRGDM